MISIIVPVFNIEKYISKCIENILNQTDHNWELILVNDGSTDKSKVICESYLKINDNIRLINKANGGLSSARNAGLDKINGDWVLFLDGDDYILPHTIEVLTKILNDAPPDLDFLQYGYQEISEGDINGIKIEQNTDIEYISDLSEKFKRLINIGGEAASGCTKLIRKEILLNLKFKEGIIHEDEEFTQRLLIESKLVGYFPNFKPYIYIKRSGSIITSGFNRKRLDILPIMNERLKLLADNDQEDLISLFRKNFINSLMILYLAASAVKEKEACRILMKELSKQIKAFKLNDSSIKPTKKIKLFLIKHHLPILQFESILRKILRKQIIL